MKTTRREFFKLPAAIAVVATVPGIANAAQSVASVLPEILVRDPVVYPIAGDDMVRELIAYSIGVDKYIARFDVCDGKTQLHVESDVITYKCRDPGVEGRQYVKELRERLYPMLHAEMIAKGMKYEDLIPLPVPEGAMSLKQFD